ncbi:MAG: VOC family protein [Cyanobacteria bacterium J069]|nr:MAG: VOC family protein [Cyanobacteria bacterium J069]
MIQIRQLDHLVLTVRDIPATCAFYQTVLGMEVITFGQGRTALRFGQQKINLHPAGAEIDPKAQHPTPGSADLCLLTDTPIADVAQWLETCGVPIELGIVPRTGATGNLASLYIRDPDGNLIELANVIE